MATKRKASINTANYILKLFAGFVKKENILISLASATNLLTLSKPVAVDPAVRDSDRQSIAGFRPHNRSRTCRPGRTGSFVGGGSSAPIRFARGKSVVGAAARGRMGTTEASQRVGCQAGIVLPLIKRPDSLIPLRIGG